MKAVLIALLCATVTLAQNAKERALGRALATEVEQRETMVHDPAIMNSIERLVSRLATRCFQNTTVEAHVVVSNEPNAHALPGIVLFVNTGLIRETESEAELIGVLAHLIARVLPRPSQDGMPLIFVAGRSGYSYRPEANAPMAFVRAQRAAVTTADAQAVGCVSSAGYDPEAFVGSLKRMQTVTGEEPFSTHPRPAERVESAQAQIAQIAPEAQYVLNTDAFDELKQRVDQLYPAPRANDPKPPTLRRAALP